jgi:hypothetical protein
MVFIVMELDVGGIGVGGQVTIIFQEAGHDVFGLMV